MLFDSHAHLNFDAFKDDYKDVIVDCEKNNIWMVNIGSQYETSKRGVEIARDYKHAFSAVGLHPTHAHEKEHAFDYKKYSDLAQSSKKVVAIGETGIDFYHSIEHFEIQKEVFLQHIRLAKEFDLALVIHGRNSKDGTVNCYEEIFKIVKKEKVKRAVVHCFIGNQDDAKKFLELGYYIGITGIITFSAKGGSASHSGSDPSAMSSGLSGDPSGSRTTGGKNALYQTMVRDTIPLEQLLIETDCPYLAPEPYRGKRNQPQYVEYVARKIAEIKGKTFEEVAEITFKNSKIFFQ